MKLKSMILASAASLFAVNGAVAADAIVAVDPEPVNYVEICDAYGAGYFFIPGTEVCLDISGRVRVQFQYDSVTERLSQDTDFRVGFDAKHESDLGTIGASIRIGDGEVDPAGDDVNVERAFITIQPTDAFTVTMGYAGDKWDDTNAFVIGAGYSAGGLSVDLQYNDIGAIIGGDAVLGQNANEYITLTASYSFGAFSVEGGYLYHFLAGDNYGAYIGGKYTADKFDIGLRYDFADGVVPGDLVGGDLGAVDRDELSIDLGFNATDKITLSSDWDVYFQGGGFGVENTISYKPSGNFEIAAELDYLSDDANAGVDRWRLGLDFIATF